MSSFQTYPGPGKCPHHKDRWLVYSLNEDAWLCQLCARDGEPVYRGQPLTEAMREDMGKIAAWETAEKLAKERKAKRDG